MHVEEQPTSFLTHQIADLRERVRNLEKRVDRISMSALKRFWQWLTGQWHDRRNLKWS